MDESDRTLLTTEMSEKKMALCTNYMFLFLPVVVLLLLLLRLLLVYECFGILLQHFDFLITNIGH